MKHRGDRGATFLADGEERIAAAQDRRIARGPAAYVEVERDWSSAEGARELKRRIEGFWKEQLGREVQCRVEPAGMGIYVVRSDLVGGRPGG